MYGKLHNFTSFIEAQWSIFQVEMIAVNYLNDVAFWWKSFNKVLFTHFTSKFNYMPYICVNLISTVNYCPCFFFKYKKWFSKFTEEPFQKCIEVNIITQLSFHFIQPIESFPHLALTFLNSNTLNTLTWIKVVRKLNPTNTFIKTFYELLKESIWAKKQSF